MDIMLGNWASKNLSSMDEPKLQQFAEVLEQENPELFKWLTAQAPVPPEVRARSAPPSSSHRARLTDSACRRGRRTSQADSEVMRMICSDLKASMNEYATVRSPNGSWEGKVWE